MEPATDGENVPPVPEALATARMPLGLWIGIILALLGVMLTGVAWVWQIFGIPIAPNFDTFLTVLYGVEAARDLVVGVGFFLLFMALGRLLPAGVRPVHLGSLLILVGSVALASGTGVNALLFTFSGTPGPSTQAVALVVVSLVIAGSIATSLGVVIALYGVARGALARTTIPAPPALP